MINTYTMIDFDLVKGGRSMEFRVLIDSDILLDGPGSFEPHKDETEIRPDPNSYRTCQVRANFGSRLNKILHYLDNENVSGFGFSIFPCEGLRRQDAGEPKYCPRTVCDVSRIRLIGQLPSEGEFFRQLKRLSDAT